MRIVGLRTFLSMPNGTVYAKYEPQTFGEICIKGGNIAGTPDFRYRGLIMLDVEDSGEHIETLDLAEKTGCSFPLDFYCEERDGLFNRGQLYAVFERTDVEGLIHLLNESFATAYAPREKERPF
jgi:hypothetical protein